MDAIDYLALVSRWIHLLSVIVAIGGSIFMRFVLAPVGHVVLPEDIHKTLRQHLLARWSSFVHLAVALLLITGSFNFYMAFHDNVRPLPYHPIFGVKLILALIVFFFAIALAGTGPGFQSIRRNRHKSMTILVTLAVLVVLLSGVLKTVHQAALTAQPG